MPIPRRSAGLVDREYDPSASGVDAAADGNVSTSPLSSSQKQSNRTNKLSRLLLLQMPPAEEENPMCSSQQQQQQQQQARYNRNDTVRHEDDQHHGEEVSRTRRTRNGVGRESTWRSSRPPPAAGVRRRAVQLAAFFLALLLSSRSCGTGRTACGCWAWQIITPAAKIIIIPRSKPTLSNQQQWQQNDPPRNILIQMKHEGMFLETTSMIPAVPGTTARATSGRQSVGNGGGNHRRSDNDEEQKLRSSIPSHPQRTVLGFDVRRSSSTGTTRLQLSSSSTTPSSSSSSEQQQQSSNNNNNNNTNKNGTRKKTIVLPSSLRKISYKWGDHQATNNNADNDQSMETTSGDNMEDDDNSLMTVVQLKAQLHQYGLATSGTKAVLRDRLRQQRRRNNNNKVSSSSSSPPLVQPEKAAVPNVVVDEPPPGSIIDDHEVKIISPPANDAVDQTDPAAAGPTSGIIGMGLSADIAAILQRRRDIHKQKSLPWTSQKKNKKDDDDDEKANNLAHARQVLQKIYQKPSSSLERSQHASRVYQAAKQADQTGDRETAKYLLRSLLVADDGIMQYNDDARILRRLARMEHEDGQTEVAIQILQQGLATHHPNDPHLWLGLATLQDATNVEAKRECYKKALVADPHFAHAYHALATLEHTEGSIKRALKVLQTGLRYCPTNHRLHHALGDLYRDAKILPRATASYQKALEYGPVISHGYAITALAFCAYEENNVDLCRNYLQRAIDGNPRQAHAWMSLAQLEESLGHVEAGRNVCRTAIAEYERYLLKKYRPQYKRQPNKKRNDDHDDDDHDDDDKKQDHRHRAADDPVAYKNELLRQIPRHRSGDKFLHVYRTWLRMESRYGTVESFEAVYQQASAAFTDVRIQLDAARYYASHGLNEQARQRFMDACKCSSRSVDAFRTFGLHEMKLGNYALAERIFYTGAMTGRTYFLAELLYAWAVCEWRTDQLQNAARLFEFAIEESGGNVRLRSFILFVSARFEFSRREYHRAQHFVGRCLAEYPNHIPGGNEQVWTLWKKIAEAMGDERLAQRCHHQAWQSVLDENEATRVQKGDLQQQMRREPWTSQVFSLHPDADAIYNLDILPKDEHDDDISLFENSLRADDTLVNS